VLGVSRTDPDTAAAWRDPRSRLRALAASGGTEIYQGLRAGLDELSRLGGNGRTAHLILLTDGHTYGDADHCLHLAATAAARGIGITAFGLGADWNDAFLDALVAPSGGQSHYIETPGDVLPHLEKRLAGLGDSHARGVALRHAWPGQLTLRAGFKLSPYPQPLTPETNPIPLGDLEGRAPLTLLLEFVVAPLSVPARFRLPIELRYSRPDGGEASLSRAAQLLAQSGAGDADPPAALIEAARRLNLYRMQEKAWEEAQSGQLDTAAARMRRLTARYLETGDLRLAQQAQLEAQRLGHLGTMSAEGRKVLKYGTRSLLGQLPEEGAR
jgi:Ca-activated chloride channel family protein